MKFPTPHTLEQIATLLNCEFVGAKDFPVMGMNEIHVVQNGEIVFVDHPKYYDKALQSAASVVLINKRVACPEGKALLISDDPFRDFNVLTRFFRPFEKAQGPISVSANIGEGTVVQPNVFIGNHVTIGKNCVIHANAVLYDHCVLGDNITVHSGAVLGADAFYYKNRPEGFDQLRSGGRVVIHDKVDIGAGCTIDRGVTGDTVIGEGSKLDNQVHVGHDCRIGKKCLIAAQTGIAGCVIIEDEVTIWGQVGISSTVTIGKKAVLLAQTGVTKSLPGGKTYFGSPMGESREKLKELANIKKIPAILKKIGE